MRTLIFVVLASIQFTSAMAQSATEAKFVLRDVERWLPGTYDNEAQRFVEAAFGAGEEGSHPWLHLVIESEKDSDLGDAVFRVTQSNRADPSTGEQQYLLAFSVDEAMRAVSMARFGGDGEPENGCSVYWRQGPGHVYGTSSDNSCDGTSGRQELKLTAGEFWELDEAREDDVPLRLMKVRWYDCFALVHHDVAGELTMKNPFTLHDGGDVFEFDTEEQTPRKIEVLLRRSMWTSRSGNNFVPLLQLNVFENGVRDEPIANAWSAADSGRVGFAAGGVGSARCKLATSIP